MKFVHNLSNANSCNLVTSQFCGISTATMESKKTDIFIKIKRLKNDCYVIVPGCLVLASKLAFRRLTLNYVKYDGKFYFKLKRFVPFQTRQTLNLKQLSYTFSTIKLLT